MPHNLLEYKKSQVCLNTIRYYEPENADTSFTEYEICESLQNSHSLQSFLWLGSKEQDLFQQTV